MSTFLLVIHVVLSIIIVISVLLQKSSSMGLGVYSGSNESLFGAKGSASFMAKFTMFMGLLFIINTIALSIFYTKNASRSIMDANIIENKEVNKLNPLENPLNSDSLLVPSAPLNKDNK